MYESTYEIIAIALRYWFIALVVFILIRLTLNVRSELIAQRTIKTKAKGFSLGMLIIREPATKKLLDKQFILKRDNTIGRAQRCDIIIKHSSVSSVHAAIYQKGANIFLSDYGGRGGVYLNDKKITRKDEILSDGDEIRIGEVCMEISVMNLNSDKEQAEEGED